MNKKRPSKDNANALVEYLKDRLSALIVCVSNAWGGLEQVAVQDAIDLHEAGIRVRVLCLLGSPIEEHLKEIKGLKIVGLQERPRDFLDFRLRAHLKSLFLDGVNLIHVHQPSLLGSIIPWLFGHKDVVVVASRHIMNNHSKKGFFHRTLYRRLDALVVMSQTLRENVLGTHAIRDKQVKVIHLGIDFDRFNHGEVEISSHRKQWGAKEDTLVIGMVGRIDPAKGQGTFIKAAASLLQRMESESENPIDLKFVVVGEETRDSQENYLEELKELVKQFHLEERVVFAGYREDIPEVMGAFDIFVMPSRQEAFGLVAIEAMAMECPVVISRGGSAREIVGNEEFGLLMRPDDAFDLRKQLKYLIDHPEKRKEMGKKARAYVQEHYNHHVRFRDTLELYERSLRRRSLLEG